MLSNPVTITFQCPDYNADRNGATASAHDPGVDVVVGGFDLDYGLITAYPLGDQRGENFHLAVRAPAMNEDGRELGDVGWILEPAGELLEAIPGLREHIGKRYARVIVTAADETATSAATSTVAPPVEAAPVSQLHLQHDRYGTVVRLYDQTKDNPNELNVVGLGNGLVCVALEDRDGGNVQLETIVHPDAIRAALALVAIDRLTVLEQHV